MILKSRYKYFAFLKGGEIMGICNKCDIGKLIFNEEWDREFDSLDRNYPDYYSINKELIRRGIPKYTCSNCKNEVFGK